MQKTKAIYEISENFGCSFSTKSSGASRERSVESSCSAPFYEISENFGTTGPSVGNHLKSSKTFYKLKAPRNGFSNIFGSVMSGVSSLFRSSGKSKQLPPSSGTNSVQKEARKSKRRLPSLNLKGSSSSGSMKSEDFDCNSMEGNNDTKTKSEVSSEKGISKDGDLTPPSNGINSIKQAARKSKPRPPPLNLKGSSSSSSMKSEDFDCNSMEDNNDSKPKSEVSSEKGISKDGDLTPPSSGTNSVKQEARKSKPRLPPLNLKGFSSSGSMKSEDFDCNSLEGNNDTKPKSEVSSEKGISKDGDLTSPSSGTNSVKQEARKFKPRPPPLNLKGFSMLASISKDGDLTKLIHLQMANGSFKFGQALQDLVGMTENQIMEKCHGVEVDGVWITVVALALLEKKFPEEKELWELIANKAKMFIQTNTLANFDNTMKRANAIFV